MGELHILNETYSNSSCGKSAILCDYLLDHIPVFCIFLALFIVGSTGNIITCVVIAKNTSMHTLTNYYLSNLAISDFLILVSMGPFFIIRLCTGASTFTWCILNVFITEAASNAAILTTTAFSIERYLAICHPLYTYTRSDLPKIWKYIALIWMAAMMFGVPTCMGCICEGGSFVRHMRYVIGVSAFLFFVVPMVLITVFYVLIGVKLRSRSKLLKLAGKSASTDEARVVRILVAVVVVFIISWTPFQVVRFLMTYNASLTQTLVTFRLISGILTFVGSSFNPVLYNLMSKKFREAFKATFKEMCRSQMFTKLSLPSEVNVIN